MNPTAAIDERWKGIVKISGIAAGFAILVIILEMAITFTPVGGASQDTVQDWFSLFLEHPFMGLRNMGLLNIFMNLSGIFVYLGLYSVHKGTRFETHTIMVLVLALLGAGIFLATNRAFPMLALSKEYSTASAESERLVIEAAGRSMLAVGASHTAGTFTAFTLSEISGILVSVIMLRSGIFRKTGAYAGIIGFSAFLIFEVSSSFFSGLSNTIIVLAMVGGIFNLVWYGFTARRLIQLGYDA